MVESKKKFRVWQPGFEHEAVVVECDEDECPTCAQGGPPPYMATGDAIVISFMSVSDDGTTSAAIKHRHMTCVRLGLAAWMCRRATDEEVAEALKMADNIRSGREKDLKVERESSGDVPPGDKPGVSSDKSGVSVETFVDMVEMFASPASWAARQGAELGAKVLARTCTCEHALGKHEQIYKKLYEKAQIGRRAVGGKCLVDGCSCVKFEAARAST